MTKSAARPSPETPLDDDPLYQAAIKVERDEALVAEMPEWEQATFADGLDYFASI